ncbi:hypothetical protein MOC02_18095 [Bacillus inaquosorum]|uniref:hypothetical protein n=1 Tax=Bacillus inaquosorum TaxID=483913 RepID=UPI002281BAB1|nr:hypothetical protein [Bacillus inaquosorum]MCY8085126.1 hypothetical protein [Bacillus inaquosorum]
MNNGEITFGAIKPVFHTFCKDGDIQRTSIVGYKIEYSTSSLEDEVKSGFKADGDILFPVSMLGKSRGETVKNVVDMINEDK